MRKAVEEIGGEPLESLGFEEQASESEQVFIDRGRSPQESPKT